MMDRLYAELERNGTGPFGDARVWVWRLSPDVFEGIKDALRAEGVPNVPEPFAGPTDMTRLLGYRVTLVDEPPNTLHLEALA